MLLLRKIAWCFLLLWGASCISNVCSAQRFSKLFDFNNNSDGATNVSITQQGTYFVSGWSYSQAYRYAAVNSIISADGTTIIDSHMLFQPRTTYYMGAAGAVQKLGNYFVSPYSHYLQFGAAGIVKYDSAGDTVFTRTYNDTTQYGDAGIYLAVLPDSSFIIAGERDTAFLSMRRPWAYLQHISATGDLLWMKTYEVDTSGENAFTSVQALPNGHLLVGGSISKYVVIDRFNTFRKSFPWFLELDSAGTVLKDTLYPTTYFGGGNIYRDVNGGYFHYGIKDSIPLPIPSSPGWNGNYPYYIAHLDTDFRMTWIRTFPSSHDKPQLYFSRIVNAIQLRDGGYLVMGTHDSSYINGWAARLDRRGQLKWQHTYWVDSTQSGYLEDAEERPDGSGFVLVAWTNGCSQDIWLLSIDSNGCEQPGCGNGLEALAVPHTPMVKAAFELYPNPTTGAFTVNSAQAGQLLIYNLQGMKVAAFEVQVGKQAVSLPTSLSAGIYIGQYRSMDGQASQVVRINYQP